MTQFPDTVNPIEPEITEPPKWPKVIGIISVVLGSLFLLCGGCGLGVMPFMESLTGAAKDAPGGLPPTMQPTVEMYASGAAGLLWSVVLIAAGITLLMRKAVARQMFMVWVCGAIPLAIWGTLISLHLKSQMADFATKFPDSPFSKGVGGPLDYLGPAIQLVLGYTYPVFCGVWFGMVKKKPEEYTRGVEQLM